jgi:NADPH2:quinone reductase
MKAVAIHEFGGREKLQVMDLPVPEVHDGEILLRVKAAGVNPVDWKIREGLLKDVFPHKFPLILGWDAAGIVTKTGKGVSRFSEGDKIYAYCRKAIVCEGAYAEYIVLPEENLSKKPINMTFFEAATVPLACLTAYQSLFDTAKLKGGETLLVHAAAGGVGTFAVQLAKSCGAIVLGTASSRNHSYLNDLGIDEAIDYTKQDFRDSIKAICRGGVDVIFNCVGGDVLPRCPDVLKANGRLVSIVDPDGIEDLKVKGFNAEFVFVQPNHDELSQITKMIEAGKLSTFISASFPLEEAAKAHEMNETRHVKGKIFLKI